MRDWLRRLVFDHLSWPIRLLAGGLNAALALWWIRPSGEGAAAITACVVVASIGAVFVLMKFSAPVEGRGYSLPGLRQVVLELTFSATLLGAATVAALILGFALETVLPDAWAGGPSAASTAFSFQGLAVGGAGAALAWGFLFGRRARRTSQVVLPELPTQAQRRTLRIVHLSDLHLGNGMSAADLGNLARDVQELAPDLIVFTGDFFDQRRDVIGDCARALDAFHAPFGVYAILGNHDVYTGTDIVSAAFARHAPSIEELDLWVAGLEDPGDDWSGAASDRPALSHLAAAVGNPGRSLLLIHRPEGFEAAAELGFARVFAGHYHGGQIALPGSGGRVNVAAAFAPWDRGLHRLGASTLYVSCGLGTAGPRLRIACPGEIAVHELTVGATAAAVAGEGQSSDERYSR